MSNRGVPSVLNNKKNENQFPTTGFVMLKKAFYIKRYIVTLLLKIVKIVPFLLTGNGIMVRKAQGSPPCPLATG
jgi:hypothetical protein